MHTDDPGSESSHSGPVDRIIRKWADRCLREVLAASGPILDQIAEAVFVFSPKGPLVYANKTACRMLGYERDEIIGRSAGVVFSQMENAPEMEGLCVQKAMRSFAVPPFDTALRDQNGQLINVSFSTSFLRNADNEVIGILGIAHDIRERRALEFQLRMHNELLEEEVASRISDIQVSERRFEMLVEQIPSAVVQVDHEGQIVSFNRAASSLFGWDAGAQGRPVCELWGCSDCVSADSCHSTLHSQQPWFGECLMRRGDGSPVVAVHTCASATGEDGRSLGTIHVLTDIADPGILPPHDLLKDAQGMVICSQRGHGRLVTCSGKMRRVLELIATAANSSETVLVEGDSGTGKELVARALHLNSDRSDGPYVPINCASLKEHLLESELFGHERGAFTGAVATKKGLMEVADGGTLFIDEVAELEPAVQAMLLRVLETGRFRRLGAVAELEVDVRVIAATNKDLEREVNAGRFRDDLFYRLNVLRIKLPPLRDRPEDIPLLVDHFLQRMASEMPGGTRKRVVGTTMRLLLRYAWPGNVRELLNVLKHGAVVSGSRSLICERDLPPQIAAAAKTEPHERLELSHIEKEHIRRVFRKAGGNKSLAAKMLGISRSTLQRKIREYQE
jgi:PAS domain S-box-containing protein